MAIRARPVSLWRNRDYLLLWGGQLVSSTGSGVSQIAYPLLVLAITCSPAQAGLVGAARAAAYAIFVLPAGALVDRWDRQRLMIWSDVGRACCLASIPLALILGHLTIVQLSITGFVEVVLGTFFDIAEVACLPRVVETEQLPAAMGRVQATLGVTNLLGPTLGGALFTLGAALPFLADAVSYVASIYSLLLIRVPFQAGRSSTKRHLGVEIAEGLRWLWRQPLLRSLALLTGGSNFAGAGYTLIIIVIAQRQHASSATIGLIFGVAGAGGILGSLLASPAQRRFGFVGVIVGTLWLYPLVWLPLAVTPAPLALGLLTAADFLIAPSYNVAYVSRRLALTPDALQGRVNSAARLIAFGAAPVGLAVTGFLLQAAGPAPTVLALVAWQGLLALAATADPATREAPVVAEQVAS